VRHRAHTTEKEGKILPVIAQSSTKGEECAASERGWLGPGGARSVGGRICRERADTAKGCLCVALVVWWPGCSGVVWVEGGVTSRVLVADSRRVLSL
jgi:hypothetical protein